MSQACLTARDPGALVTQASRNACPQVMFRALPDESSWSPLFAVRVPGGFSC